MGDTIVEPAPLKPTSEPAPGPPGNNGGSLLSVITEGVGELSVIDPEVAQKACQEVLEKVKLLPVTFMFSSLNCILFLM